MICNLARATLPFSFYNLSCSFVIIILIYYLPGTLLLVSHPSIPINLWYWCQPVYDLIAIGAGAGGLVSAKQSARRGAKSAMISEKMAGGDCLNVGCVPSKALLSATKTIAAVKRSAEFGVLLNGEMKVDFGKIMTRLRQLRTKIAPADGHGGTAGTCDHVYQGWGVPILSRLTILS
jgi:hypothetical protein